MVLRRAQGSGARQVQRLDRRGRRRTTSGSARSWGSTLVGSDRKLHRGGDGRGAAASCASTRRVANDEHEIADVRRRASCTAPTSRTGRVKRRVAAASGAGRGRGAGRRWARCWRATRSRTRACAGAGLITVTHVRVSGDLRHARALFTVHGAGRGRTGAGARGAGSRERLFPPGDRAAVADEGRAGGDVRGGPGVRAGGEGRAAAARDCAAGPGAGSDRGRRRRGRPTPTRTPKARRRMSERWACWSSTSRSGRPRSTSSRQVRRAAG